MPLKDIPKTRVLQAHTLVTIQVFKQWRIQDFPEGEPTPNIDVLTYHYRPQQSCGKVMFSHVSVTLFTEGLVSVPACTRGGGLCPGGVFIKVTNSKSQISNFSFQKYLE